MALLQDNFCPAISRDDIGCGAIIEVPSTSSRSDHFAACFLELEKLNQELKSKLRDDFLSILNGMSNMNLSSNPQLPSPSSTPPSRSSSLIHGTSFITEAYSWLLENIANPYPSSTVKASLAQRYNSSLSAINSWFINARKRMGWTAVCRDYFNSCRANALDAAHRALVEEDPKRQLPANVIHAFISVKAAAEELYSSTLTKSVLAGDLGAVVDDMPDQNGISAHKKKHSERTLELSKPSDMDPQNKKLVTPNCYPTPNHSPSPCSLVPMLDETPTDETEDDEHTPSPILAGRKRRFSSSEGPHTPKIESTARLVKRLRPNSSISASVNARFACPATNADKFSENNRTLLSIPNTQGFTNPITREQHLSNTDMAKSPKHPQDSLVGPHLHSVPAPLPLSLESEQSIDEWFRTNFDDPFVLPPPVDVTEPDHSTPWEVELFKNYIIPDPQESLAPLIPDNQIPSSTDFISLEDILQSKSYGSMVPPEITHPLTITPLPDPASQDLSLLSDLSQSIDWTALLNEDPSALAGGSLCPQSYANSALPEIDLSILQLPLAWTMVAS